MIIQAENDEGDLAEMRDGILKGIELGEKWDSKNLLICTEDSRTSEEFTSTLEGLIKLHKPDLVIIDPLLAYVGGNVLEQEVMSKFLRNQLNPILHEHLCGCIIIHHTNKPSKEKSDGSASDSAYAGSGSAELANWPRGVICLYSTKNHGLFELILAKRGNRVGWKGKNGEKVYSKGHLRKTYSNFR